MRKTLLIAIGLLLFPGMVLALPHHGNIQNPIVTQTPTLQDMTINEGIATSALSGNVDLESLMLTTGSAPAKAFIVEQTTGPSGSANSYYETICDYTGGSPHLIPSGSTYQIDNNCALQTPVMTQGNKGSGYSNSTQLALDSGECITLTATDTDPDTGITGIIDSWTVNNAPATGNPSYQSAYSIGNTHIVASNTNCSPGLPANGVNASFTTQYYGKAQSPMVTAAGQNNNWGYALNPGGCNTTHNCTLNNGAIVISVVGVGFDNSQSATHNLTINLDPRGCNVGPFQKFFDLTYDCGWGNGSSYTNGLQAWRNNEYNVVSGASSTGDLHLYMSSGRNQWANPNNTVCCGIEVQVNLNDVNYGYAVLNDSGHGAGTPSVTDLLTYTQACRANGAVLVAATASKPAVYACNSGASVTSNLGKIIAHGVCPGGGCSPTASCRGTSTGNPGTNINDGTTFIDLNGLRMGGTPKYNYILGSVFGIDMGQSCDIFVTNYLTDLPRTFSNGTLLSADSGIDYNALEVDAFNNHIFVNQGQAYGVSYPVTDGGTSGTPSPSGNGSLDVEINSNYAQWYFTNGWSTSMATFHTQDIYLCGSAEYPFSPYHVDPYQLSNGLLSYNSTNKRWYVMPCGSNPADNGFFYGAALQGAPPIGLQFDCCLFASNSSTDPLIEGMDSVTGQAASFNHFTLWRQQPVNAPSNGSNPDWGEFCADPSCNNISVGRNPTPGVDVLEIPVGCNALLGRAAYVSCLASEPVYTAAFVASGAGTDQINVGSTIAITLANVAAAIGTTSQLGRCVDANSNPITFGPISNRYALYSAAHGGSGAHICMTVPSSDQINGIYIDEPASLGNVYYPLIGCPYTPGSTLSSNNSHCDSSGVTSWFVTQFAASESDLLINKPVDSASNPGQTQNYGPIFTFNNGASTASNCLSGTSYYCGVFTADENAIFDSVETSSSEWYTESAARSGLGTTYFNFTLNNRIFANDFQCAYQGGSGNGGRCTYFGMFANDTTNNGPEQQLEAKSWNFWATSTPATIVATYAAAFLPASGQTLDLGSGAWAGGQTSAGVANDGSGHAWGWDFNGTTAGSLDPSGKYAYAN